MAAVTVDGSPLAEADLSKLKRLPLKMEEPYDGYESASALAEDLLGRQTDGLREISLRNLGSIEQEVQTLTAWADDLKLGIEHEIEEIARQFKEFRRTAASALTLDEKLSGQQHNVSLRVRVRSCGVSSSTSKMKSRPGETTSSVSLRAISKHKSRSGLLSEFNGS